MPRLHSKSKFLEIAVKNYIQADSKVSKSCPILLDFFTYFQILCPGLWMFIIPGKNLLLWVPALKQEIIFKNI